MKNNELEKACGQEPNEIAQAPPAPEVNETSPASAGGCLPRSCSALSDRTLGESDSEGVTSPEWEEIAESNSKALEEITKK